MIIFYLRFIKTFKGLNAKYKVSTMTHRSNLGCSLRSTWPTCKVKLSHSIDTPHPPQTHRPPPTHHWPPAPIDSLQANKK